VADGRDAGTVIFPQAAYKFFLDAGPAIRAQRRYKELLEKNIKVSYDDIFNDIQNRDKNDSTRAHSPLKPAEDAVIVDTSEMSIEDVCTCILKHIQKKRSSLS
jgi:cytidylate kinase